MSFQLGHVRERESMGGGPKKVTTMIDGIRKHRLTTSNLRFPCPRAIQRWNDMLSAACSSLRWDDMPAETWNNPPHRMT